MHVHILFRYFSDHCYSLLWWASDSTGNWCFYTSFKFKLHYWESQTRRTAKMQWWTLEIALKSVRGTSTHWGRDKIVATFQTIFSNAFEMRMYKFLLRFHWSLFPRVQLTIFQYWFRLWLGADQAISNYLNQWWLVYWHICASLEFNELDWILIIVMVNHALCMSCSFGQSARALESRCVFVP